MLYFDQTAQKSLHKTLTANEMKRKIYHGSKRIVSHPAFGSGISSNDFGLGFYCTDNIRLAAEWAAGRQADGFVNIYSIETDGLRIINLNSPEYCILHWLAVLLNHREFDAVNSQVYQAKDYLRTKFSVEYQNCDCLMGFRADNSNFMFAQDFLDGRISYREFNNAVRLGDTGRQFVLKSNRAFDRLIFEGYETARYAESYPAAVTRDRSARYKTFVSAYNSSIAGIDTETHSIASVRQNTVTLEKEHKGMRNTDISLRNNQKRKPKKESCPIYIDDIIRENIKPYDSRLL